MWWRSMRSYSFARRSPVWLDSDDADGDDVRVVRVSSGASGPWGWGHVEIGHRAFCQGTVSRVERSTTVDPMERSRGPGAGDVLALVAARTGGLDVDDVEAGVWRWVTAPEFMTLVQRCAGPTLRSSTDLRSWLAALDDFSEAWDFRKGRERDGAAIASLSAEVETDALTAADRFGLRSGPTRPPGDRYDHCLVLGGLVRACAIRPRWAARLVHDGVDMRTVTAIGALRQLSSQERELARPTALAHVTSEFEALDEGMRRAFQITAAPEVDGRHVEGEPNRGWLTHRYCTDDDRRVDVVAAPSTVPEVRRANTADAFVWWAERIAKLQPEHRVLLVTSSIYVPFQHADALRTLAASYGCGIDTVGVPSAITAGMAAQIFTSANYLQEIRSTIRSFRLLVESLPTA
jgi:hypothetical protein